MRRPTLRLQLLFSATALFLAVAVACSSDLNIDTVQYACSTDAECGAGFVCGIRGLCIPAAEAPPTEDSGALPPDAGNTARDAARPDTGTVPPDAATLPPDAALLPPDAAVVPPDAGSADAAAGCTSSSCARGYVCSASTGTCVIAAGLPCVKNTDCGVGGACTPPDVAPGEFNGGYCTMPCTPSGGECVAGTVCAPTRMHPSGAAASCVRSCNSNADCRVSEGYGCVPLSIAGAGAHGCMPASTNLTGNPVGDRCTQNTDCLSAGQCLPASAGYPNGYCTVSYCTFGQSCGTKALCVLGGPDWGYCFQTCSTDAACRSAYHCVGEGHTAKLCEPRVDNSAVLVGDPCSASTTCGTNGTCDSSSDFADGYCTALCSSDSECPAGSKCLEYTRAGRPYTRCLKTCGAATDCRTGYDCLAPGPAATDAGTADAGSSADAGAFVTSDAGFCLPWTF